MRCSVRAGRVARTVTLPACGRAVQRELPAEQSLRAPRLAGGVSRRALEVAEHRDAGRDEVEAARVGADHGLVDPARARLQDAPVEVDDEVVADVVPAADVAVEDVDRADHRGHLGRRRSRSGSRCGARTPFDGAVAAARRCGWLLPAGPGAARDDRRLARPGRQARRARAAGSRPCCASPTAPGRQRVTARTPSAAARARAAAIRRAAAAHIGSPIGSARRGRRARGPRRRRRTHGLQRAARGRGSAPRSAASPGARHCRPTHRDAGRRGVDRRAGARRAVPTATAVTTVAPCSARGRRPRASGGQRQRAKRAGAGGGEKLPARLAPRSPIAARARA